MKIELFTIAWNEEKFLPSFLDHYINTVKVDNIVLFDNHSTDRTVEIAKSAGCEVYPYGGNDQNNMTMLFVKETCWKDSPADWVIVCDVDELLYHPRGVREVLSSTDATIVKPKGYQMVSEESIDYRQIRIGNKNHYFDKTICFKPSEIKEMNWAIGCHENRPVGNIKYITDDFKLLHYCFWGRENYKERWRRYSKRISELDMQMGAGAHYLQSDEEKDEIFNNALLHSGVAW